MNEPMIFRRTCKQAAELLVAREDSNLRWNDVLALRLHLVACDACPRFEKQIMTLRNALARWRNSSD